MYFVANKNTVPTISYAYRKQRINITIYHIIRHSTCKADSRLSTHSTLNSVSNIRRIIFTFPVHSKKCYLTEMLQGDNGVVSLKHTISDWGTRPINALFNIYVRHYVSVTSILNKTREILRNVGTPYNFDTVPNPKDCTRTFSFISVNICWIYLKSYQRSWLI